jgi:hypothetical protein
VIEGYLFAAGIAHMPSVIGLRMLYFHQKWRLSITPVCRKNNSIASLHIDEKCSTDVSMGTNDFLARVDHCHGVHPNDGPIALFNYRGSHTIV